MSDLSIWQPLALRIWKHKSIYGLSIDTQAEFHPWGFSFSHLKGFLGILYTLFPPPPSPPKAGLF